jgi:hypothetical protein
MPRSSCIHRALPDGVRRCSLEGSASGPPPPAISPPESSRSWWCCRSCLLLAAVRGAQPRGGWRSSAIARFQGFSSWSPAATSHRWSSTRMTTSLVVERSEPGCGLPPPSASRMFIILAGVEGEPSWGPAFRMGWRPTSSSSIRGEGRSLALRRRRTSATRGWLATGAVSCRVSGSLAWVALVPPPALPPAAWSGRGYPSTARATVAPCAGPPHPRLLPRRRPHRGGGVRVLGWSCPHSRQRTGARTSSRVLRQPSPTGAEVAAVVGADVVAAAGEDARCRGGCLRWRDHQCYLPPSLQLFGYNGLVVAPRRKMGARTFSQWRTR